MWSQEESVPLRHSARDDEASRKKVEADLGIDYNFGFDSIFLKRFDIFSKSISGAFSIEVISTFFCRCARIYRIALPNKLFSFDGLMVAFLLVNIFPPVEFLNQKRARLFLKPVLKRWERNFYLLYCRGGQCG